MKHWSELPDKGPSIVEPDTRHSRGKTGASLFVIETRYVGPEQEWHKQFPWFQANREWHVHRKYKTQGQRDQALRNFKHKQALNGRREYRIGSSSP